MNLGSVCLDNPIQDWTEFNLGWTNSAQAQAEIKKMLPSFRVARVQFVQVTPQSKIMFGLKTLYAQVQVKQWPSEFRG